MRALPLLLLLAAAAAGAQETPSPPPTPVAPPPQGSAPDESPTPTPTPVPDEPFPPEEGTEEPTPSPTPEPGPAGGEFVIPRMNFYLPEGRADLRFLKPIRNSLFETQIDYDFVGGDISAFLRYKYYARSGTTTFTVFDQIEFEALERFSNEFRRTRGMLLLYRLPLDFYNRITLLGEFDRLTFSDVGELDNNQTNTYVKLGYQYGTPSDNLSNAVVGEARDRVLSLFTVYREIGPEGRGLSVAGTWGFEFLGGDYEYVKTELEALQAVRLTDDRPLFLRLHLGYFPYRKKIRDPEDPIQETPFSAPRYELFPLGGRDFLKGYRGDEREPNQITITGEYPIPLFTDAGKRFLGMDWNSLYLVAYGGTGNVGSDREVFYRVRDWKVDVGVGFEASVSWKRYRAFLSALAAYTAVGGGDGGPRFLFSLRTSR